MGEAFRIDFDAGDVFAGLDEIEAGIKAQVRPSAQVGAQVLYDEVKLRVPVSMGGHWFYGKSYKKTGQKYYFNAGSLKGAIYQVFSKDNSTDEKATYHIAWNHQKVPYGFMVEFGTSRTPAHPFLRPAFDARAMTALEAARDHMLQAAKAAVPSLT